MCTVKKGSEAISFERFHGDRHVISYHMAENRASKEVL